MEVRARHRASLVRVNAEKPAVLRRQVLTVVISSSLRESSPRNRGRSSSGDMLLRPGAEYSVKCRNSVATGKHWCRHGGTSSCLHDYIVVDTSLAGYSWLPPFNTTYDALVRYRSSPRMSWRRAVHAVARFASPSRSRSGSPGASRAAAPKLGLTRYLTFRYYCTPEYLPKVLTQGSAHSTCTVRPQLVRLCNRCYGFARSLPERLFKARH